MKPEPIYRDIAKRIRLAREQAKMTQYELADLLDVSRPSVQMMERGSQRIHLHIIIRIAEAVDVPLMWLLQPINSK